MTDDTKIAIEACCQATSGFGPRSVRPIGSVQVQSPVGPVRLHLKKCRSYALDRTGPRPNRGCPSLMEGKVKKIFTSTDSKVDRVF